MNTIYLSYKQLTYDKEINRYFIGFKEVKSIEYVDNLGIATLVDGTVQRFTLPDPVYTEQETE